MGEARNKKVALFLVITMGAGAIVFLFALLGPPNLLAKSESPDFCMKCHVMESEYEAWADAGAHRRKKCIDCHLPNVPDRIPSLESAIHRIRNL